MRAEREEQRKKRQAELAGDPFSKEVCVPGRLSVPVESPFLDSNSPCFLCQFPTSELQNPSRVSNRGRYMPCQEFPQARPLDVPCRVRAADAVRASEGLPGPLCNGGQERWCGNGSGSRDQAP